MGQKNSSKRLLQTLTLLQILKNAIFEATELSSFLYLWLQSSSLLGALLVSLVCSVQHTSPVTAQHQTAHSKETPQINSVLFLAQGAAQHPPLVSEISTAPAQHDPGTQGWNQLSTGAVLNAGSSQGSLVAPGGAQCCLLWDLPKQPPQLSSEQYL